jgi:hypothetical protein
MRLSGIRDGDIVEVDVRGQRALCLVDARRDGSLEVSPVTRGFGYRRVSARQVVAHWRRAGRRRA